MPTQRSLPLMHNHAKQLVMHLLLLIIAVFGQVHGWLIPNSFVQLLQIVCKALQLDGQNLGQFVK